MDFLGRAVRTVSALLLLILALMPLARAQGPVVAGLAPVFEGGVGYSYTQSTVPSEGSMGLNGVLLSGNADVTRRFGVKVELGYSRNFDAFHTGRTADLLTYLGGPVVYPVRHRRYNVYGEVLFGGARETGVNVNASGRLLLGFVNRFAWAAGGGVQIRLTPALSLRGGADYLRTSFFNSSVVFENQRNLRTSLSLIYTFGRHE